MEAGRNRAEPQCYRGLDEPGRTKRTLPVFCFLRGEARGYGFLPPHLRFFARCFWPRAELQQGESCRDVFKALP